MAQRVAPLTPIEFTPGATFDTKMATINASLRGLDRGIALPLLLDLARKPVFLHDNSVPTLDNLLDPTRGGSAADPFYLPKASDRSDMVTFLNSLDTNTSALNTLPFGFQKNKSRVSVVAARSLQRFLHAPPIVATALNPVEVP